MRKLLAVLMAFALAFSFSSAAWADAYDLAVKQITELETTSEAESGDLIPVYDVSSGNVKTMDAANPAIAGNSIFQSTLYAMGRKSGASSVSSSSTNLAPSTLPYAIILKSVGSSAGLDTTPGTTLQNGTPGQVLVLVIKNLMTSGTWVITPKTSAYVSYITMDTAGDTVALLYVDNVIGWIVLSNSGATVTAKTFSF